MESVFVAAITVYGKQRLKRFQYLHCSFETYSSRLDVVLARRLSENSANEIIGEDVRPNFLPHEFRCFAAQDLHLHGSLEISKIEFCIPAGTVKIRQIVA